MGSTTSVNENGIRGEARSAPGAYRPSPEVPNGPRCGPIITKGKHKGKLILDKAVLKSSDKCQYLAEYKRNFPTGLDDTAAVQCMNTNVHYLKLCMENGAKLSKIVILEVIHTEKYKVLEIVMKYQPELFIGIIPLTYHCRSIEMCRFLLEKGATLADEQPLLRGYASMSISDTKTHLELLLEHGADPQEIYNHVPVLLVERFYTWSMIPHAELLEKSNKFRTTQW